MFTVVFMIDVFCCCNTFKLPSIVRSPLNDTSPPTCNLLLKDASPVTSNVLFKVAAFDKVNVSFNVVLPVIVMSPLTAAVPLTSKFAFASTLDILIPTLLSVKRIKSLATLEIPPPSVVRETPPLSTDKELV